MKRYLLLLFSIVSWSQSEVVTNINFGASIDFTNQPVSPQSDYSKSQVIYYKEDLRFKGEINQIRYKTAFESISLENSAQWTVKMGTTTLTEFGNGVGFINQSLLTEVFSGYVSVGPGEVIINFTTPFIYSGTENLVIQVQEIQPGAASSALSGFKGREDFGNPPKRSIMTMTDNFGTSMTIENSYPATRFFGLLERCITPLFQSEPQNVEQTTATFTLADNPLITSYHYAIHPDGGEIPALLETTPGNVLAFTDLLPAQRYRLSIRSNCDDPLPRFSGQATSTKPLEIAVPHTITFDGINSRDYFPKAGFLGNVLVSTDANENSENGLLFRSAEFRMDVPSFIETGDVWTNNGGNYLGSANFIIDLTNNPTNPIFSFRLKQKLGSNLRVRIGTLQVGWTYKAFGVSDADFQTIVVNLKDYVGQKINLSIDHMSGFYSINNGRSASVDTIELKEATCLIQNQDLTITPTTTSITITGLDTTTLHDVAIVPHNYTMLDDSWISTTLPYTFSNLTVASAYRIYIRKKCGTENGVWMELLESTSPEPIVPPLAIYFANDTLGVNVAPKHNVASVIDVTSGYPVVALYQKKSNKTWVGGSTTTESQAWNENTALRSTLFMKVDARFTSTLDMTVRVRIRRMASAYTSWFRILVNGQQLGPSYNGAVNSNFQIITNNLNAYAGTEFTVELQQTGASTGFLYAGNDDRTDVSRVIFDNTTLSTTKNTWNTLTAFPNPVENTLTLKGKAALESIKIYDSQGRLIEEVTQCQQEEFTIDTSAWASGLYLVHVNANGTSLFTKVLKK